MMVIFHLTLLFLLDLTFVMPLHKYPPRIWDALKLKQGIYARLPKHYLQSLEPKTATPVHWKPHEVEYKVNPKTGVRERVQDAPIPIYYPPESQDGLWGGEGLIKGYRYANNDKVRNFSHHSKAVVQNLVFSSVFRCFTEISFADVQPSKENLETRAFQKSIVQ